MSKLLTYCSFNLMRPKDPCKVPLKDTSLRKETYHVLVLKAKKNLWKGNTVVFAYNPQMWRNKMKEELVRGTKKKNRQRNVTPSKNPEFLSRNGCIMWLDVERIRLFKAILCVLNQFSSYRSGADTSLQKIYLLSINVKLAVSFTSALSCSKYI